MAMATPPRAFGSRVAHRVFGSFALAAVAPLAVTAALVLTQVTSTLEEQAQRRLGEMSSGIGQQLLDRLLIIDDALQYLSNGDFLSNSRVFESVQMETAGTVRVLLGEPAALPEFHDGNSDLSSLIVSRQGDEPRLTMVRSFANGTIYGTIKPGYLWQAESLLPYAMDLCVVDSATRTFLYCSAPQNDELARRTMLAASNTSNPVLSWTDSEGGGNVRASQWTLFLPSRFEATPWSIIVSQPDDVAIAPLKAFTRVFPPVVITSLFLSLLLGSIQIRRIMQPLARLVRSTQQIADRNFSEPIALEGNNEFGELASAMNDMATRLDRQFDMISALADIDRLILSSQSIREVVERVMERVAAISPGYYPSVLLIDPSRKEQAHLFSRVPGNHASTLQCRAAIKSTVHNWLAGISAGSHVDSTWLRGLIPELPVVNAACAAVVAPFFRADELRGALITQMTDAKGLSEGDRASLFELSSRLAVAISASDHESELFQRAHFDTLTGLPNRQLCFDRLHQAIAQARREEHKLALLFIDVDRFKNINDSLGHTLGDELLKEIAFRLSAAIRETDTVARLGGDEYVVILPHIEGIFEVEAIVDKIFGLVSRPFYLNGQEISVSASIGITIFPDDATDADMLLQKADTAMYAAKDTGRARIEFFEEEMDRSLKEMLLMQRDLRTAFKNGQFNLVYQAQLDLESGKLLCMEALMRWHHPRRGPISPSSFVPILEDMGMIGPVGRWVIEHALASFAAWRAEGLDLPRISINVSGRQLVEDDFESFLVAQLERFDLEGHNLEIELTEHCLVEDFERTNDLLVRLSEHGIRVAIDDFGTGYSSLGYLQGLRFDSLKIDRAFVQGLPSSKSVAIVGAVIAVANALGKEVVAEGIDADHQRTKLVELGCRIGQGYLLSIPIPGDEVMEWSQRLDQTSVIEKLVAQQA